MTAVTAHECITYNLSDSMRKDAYMFQKLFESLEPASAVE